MKTRLIVKAIIQIAVTEVCIMLANSGLVTDFFEHEDGSAILFYILWQKAYFSPFDMFKFAGYKIYMYLVYFEYAVEHWI